MAASTRNPMKHPWWLVLLAAALALFQLASAGHALQIPPEIRTHLSLPPALNFVAGLLWALLFGFGTATLVRGNSRAHHYIAWVLLGFILYSTARLFLFAQSDYDRQRLPFLIVLALFISAIPAAYLLRRPNDGEI